MTYRAVPVQPFYAVEEHIECAGEDPCTTRLVATLNSICLTRVCHPIREEQPAAPLQKVAHEGESGLVEEIDLLRLRREDVREGVDR